jgi:hypothetical protein
MNKKNRIIPANGAFLAISFTLLVTGCRPAGENDANAKNAVKAVVADVVHDKAQGTVFGNIQANFEPKDLNAPKRSALASVQRPAGDFLACSLDCTTIATATFKGQIQLTCLTPNGPAHMLAETEGPPGGSRAVVFSPDSLRVVTRGHSGKMPLAIWNVASGRHLISIPPIVGQICSTWPASRIRSQCRTG